MNTASVALVRRLCTAKLGRYPVGNLCVEGCAKISIINYIFQGSAVHHHHLFRQRFSFDSLSSVFYQLGVKNKKPWFESCGGINSNRYFDSNFFYPKYGIISQWLRTAYLKVYLKPASWGHKLVFKGAEQVDFHCTSAFAWVFSLKEGWDY